MAIKRDGGVKAKQPAKQQPKVYNWTPPRNLMEAIYELRWWRLEEESWHLLIEVAENVDDPQYLRDMEERVLDDYGWR